MKKTMQTLTLTVAAIGLSAGAALAADNAHTSANAGAGVQAEAGMDTQANTDAAATPSAPSAQSTAGADVKASASTDTQVESVQASLAQEGYAVSVDGVWGPQSAEALRQFQQANNLDATGQINAETLAALNVDASASQGTAMGESRNW